MNGIETMKTVGKTENQFAIIVQTEFVPNDEIEKYFKAGCNDINIKQV